MRLPSFPHFVQTLYTISNATTRVVPSASSLLAPRLGSSLRPPTPSMPIPLLGSLFSSASTRSMSYPVQKSNDEWRAVLSPGRSSRCRRLDGIDGPPIC